MEFSVEKVAKIDKNMLIQTVTGDCRWVLKLEVNSDKAGLRCERGV